MSNPTNQPPDPARSYERAKPEAEAGMGRLDNNVATPTDDPDRTPDAATNAQPARQINAHEVTDGRAAANPARDPNQPVTPGQPDHSMHDEEPTGWDMAPTDIHDPKQKRHPRQEGKGGTP